MLLSVKRIKKLTRVIWRAVETMYMYIYIYKTFFASARSCILFKFRTLRNPNCAVCFLVFIARCNGREYRGCGKMDGLRDVYGVCMMGVDVSFCGDMWGDLH